MKNKFTPSINIERDIFNKIEYIPTQNTESVFKKIEQNYSSGIHSFEVIGSFGTGKSSFLLAFQKQLERKEFFFNSDLNIFSKNKYRVISVTGYYEGISKLININLKESVKRDFLGAIEKKYKNNKRDGFHTLILIDEFGKVLEYSAKNNPEKELSDIQRLAEFVNDHSKDIILITTLHQSFDSYSNGLTNLQRDEWSKVRGRFQHILFNEPVDQLLLLASKKINNGKSEIYHEKDLLDCVQKSGAYQLRNIDYRIARKLYPFDILAIATLTIALQKYGQNERSLFTFLNTNGSQTNKNHYINLIDVYNYLVNNFYYYLTSRYNSDFINWQAISSALQRAHEYFDEDIIIFEGIIKTIGILTIFSSKGATINKGFLTKYLSITHSYEEVENHLLELEKSKIIRFQNFRNSYVLFEGTDLDLDYLIKSADTKVTIPSNLTNYLKKYFNLHPILANAHYYKTGTPRYFDFVISEKPHGNKIEEGIDGYINIVINNKLTTDKILFHSSKYDQIIFVHIMDKNFILQNIREIEKVNHVITNEIGDDKVARKELLKLREFHIKELNQFLQQYLFKKNNNIIWYYKGSTINVESKSNFNKIVSKVCGEVYYSAPIYKNELINRNYLSGNINKARRNLLHNLFNYWDRKDIGFPSDKFPPEKTIYTTLLKSTGIHKEEGNNYYFDQPSEPSFNLLWEVMENFQLSSKISRKSILSLIEILTEKPFGLKKGFIDVWLSIWLFIKRNDFAIYYGEQFIPEMSTETIDLILKKPSDYFIKSFDLGGVKLEFFNKYRDLIKASKREKVDKISFIETIKPFLVLYKSLTYYSKQTQRLDPKTIKLRYAIAKAKDPENIFFTKFPNALGYTTNIMSNGKEIEQYFLELKKCINELQISYSNLLNRIEEAIIKEFDFNNVTFPIYKELIQKRYQSIRNFSLLKHQKIVFQRINSQLDDRDAWLISFTQSIIGKQPENFDDEDEEIFYNTLSRIKKEFDNLSDFVNLEVDIDREEAVKIEITTIGSGLKSKIVRIPKNSHDFDKLIIAKFKKIKNKNKRISLLLNLLKDELDG